MTHSTSIPDDSKSPVVGCVRCEILDRHKKYNSDAPFRRSDRVRQLRNYESPQKV